MVQMPRPRRAVVVVLAALLVAVVGVGEYRIYLRPWSDADRRTDGVVVLGPARDPGREQAGAALAARFPGVTLLVSDKEGFPCPPKPPGAARIVCFVPHPVSTQGEARWVTAYGRAHGWRSVTIVTTDDQLLRAGVRFSRCWYGQLRLHDVRIPLERAWTRFAYQNAAMAKAELWQRAC